MIRVGNCVAQWLRIRALESDSIGLESALPLSCYATSDKLLNLSESMFLHLWKRLKFLPHRKLKKQYGCTVPDTDQILTNLQRSHLKLEEIGSGYSAVPSENAHQSPHAFLHASPRPFIILSLLLSMLLSLLLTSCVTSGKSHHLCAPLYSPTEWQYY